MMFCKKCGSVMMPRRDKDKKVMACSSCSFVDKESETKTIKEVIVKEDDIEVVGNEEEKSLPKIRIECPNCKHDEAYYWLVQTRSGDEAETKFYKCLECKNIWREYD